jgi:hypothetical protein
MPKPKPKKQKYELLQPVTIRCAPGKLRGHMRRRKSELAVNTGNGEVIEQFDVVEDAAEENGGNLYL